MEERRKKKSENPKKQGHWLDGRWQKGNDRKKNILIKIRRGLDTEK